MEAAIRISNVSKSFKVYYDKASSLKEKILFRKRQRHDVHRVLDNVSITIRKGEAIGLIGRNGCGKSTLLKLITKIIYPDQGSIEVNGRVSSLLELGAGFHPDMSGRENIFINASIFGISHAEIEKRVEDIIAFAELEEFIDNPVRTYSSGMYMRLAFAVAINVDADILLIDEILAVGDAAFQAKCFNKLREIRSRGTTIVIVSHSLGQIEQICDRSVWICDGHVAMDGKPVDIHLQYIRYMSSTYGVQQNLTETPAEVHAATEEIATQPEEMPAAPSDNQTEQTSEEHPSPAAPAENDKRWGNGQIHIEQVYTCMQEGTETNRFQVGDSMRICIKYTNPGALKQSVVGFAITRNDGLYCYGTNTYIDSQGMLNLKDRGLITLAIPQINLLQGEYLLDIAFHDESGFPYDYWRETCSFIVFSGMSEVGIARIVHSWDVTE